MIELFQSRAYLGGTFLFVTFALTFWAVFFPARRLFPGCVRTSPSMLAVIALLTWVMGIYAGTKPKPPTPQPPTPFGPTNAVVIPTARKIDGGVWFLWPSGDFEYKGETRDEYRRIQSEVLP